MRRLRTMHTGVALLAVGLVVALATVSVVGVAAPGDEATVSPPVFVRSWGSRGTAPGQFDTPRGVATFGSRWVFVVDGANHRVQKFTPAGELLTSWGGYGSGDGRFINPTGIAVDFSGYVYVVDTWNNRVQKFRPSGTFVTSWGRYGTTSGRFRFPSGVAVDPSGNVYVTDTYNDRVEVFTRSGTFVRSWGTRGSLDGQFDTPIGIAYGSNRVYVADQVNNRVQVFTTAGTFLRSWGGLGGLPGQFDQPQWVATDPLGSVYVTDGRNNRVQQFTRTGGLETAWGSFGTAAGQFNWPQGVAVGDDHSIVVVDQGNSRVQAFLPAIRRADALVWRAGNLAGDNIYNTSGTDQSQAADVRVQGSAYYLVYAQNDGTGTDGLTVRQLSCLGDIDRFKVTYDRSGTDVTAQVTGAGFPFVTVPATQWRTVGVRIKARWNADPYDWVSCRVVVASVGDPTVTDVVKVRATRR